MGFGFEIEFIDQFGNSELVTTSNYSAIVNLHNLEIT